MCPYFIAGRQRLCLHCDVQCQLQRGLTTTHDLASALLVGSSAALWIERSMLFTHVSDLCCQSECDQESLHVSAQITK